MNSPECVEIYQYYWIGTSVNAVALFAMCSEDLAISLYDKFVTAYTRGLGPCILLTKHINMLHTPRNHWKPRDSKSFSSLGRLQTGSNFITMNCWSELSPTWAAPPICKSCRNRNSHFPRNFDRKSINKYKILIHFTKRVFKLPFGIPSPD